MKRDFSKIAVLLGLVVLFVLSFRFGFLGHHFHFGWFRGMFPFLMILFIFWMFTRCGGRRRHAHCGGRRKSGAAEEPEADA